ncbi:uncharacterized protein LOC144443391 [Glandiceps talaboti]
MTSVHPEPQTSKPSTPMEIDDEIESIAAPPQHVDKPALPIANQPPPAYSAAESSPTPHPSTPPPPPPPVNDGRTETVPMQPVDQGGYPLPQMTPHPVSQGGRGLPQAFNQTMFDPMSIQVFQQCATSHKSHKQLRQAINENAESMYRDGIQHYQAHHDNLTYEQILSTILFEGEQVLLNSQYIYYTNVIFLDENSQNLADKPPMTNGRAFLTTRRLLLLSAEDGIVSSLTPQAIAKKKPNAYHLSIKWGDSMYFQSLPIEGFRSIDMRCAIGVQSDSNVHGEKPSCSKFWEGICCCFKPLCSCCELDCCMKQWSGEYPITQSYNERYVTIGTLMPPWGKRMMVRIHFDSSMRLSFINGFLVEMQRHAPNLNKLDLAPVQFMPCQMAMNRQ